VRQRQRGGSGGERLLRRDVAARIKIESKINAIL
jgi:hypothetical protein